MAVPDPSGKRVVVISDLHLGGSRTVMMSRPDRLAGFLRALALEYQGDERLELVIVGDFVDFLTIEPFACWTPDPQHACQKLHDTMDRSSFAPVFDALRDLVKTGCVLTILLGNHDLELALPAVQEALWHRLDAPRHHVLFLTDGRAHRVGGLLIEHGNRYDGANGNDWEYLRLIASAQSRAEEPPVTLRVSAGSQFVEDHVNPLKQRYPFLDLLQPQNELVALLLLAFEPTLIWDWNRIARTLAVDRQQKATSEGLQPKKTYQIAATSLDASDPELQAAFPEAYGQLRQPRHETGVGDLVRAYLENRRNSLSDILRRGEPIPADRLNQIRLLLRRLLLNDSFNWLDGPTGPYGKAAQRLLTAGAGVEAVIMGHTHLPRKVPMDGGWYINTGTWVDRIHVPDAALNDGADAELETFLRDLLTDNRPDSRPTYADVRFDRDGRIREIELKEAAS